MRRSLFRMCVTATAAPGAAAAAPSALSPLSLETKQLLVGFEQWLVGQHAGALRDVAIQFNTSGRDAALRRGLVATKAIAAGAVAVSVPMHGLVVSMASLTAALTQRGQQQQQPLLPPMALPAVASFLEARGILDPAIYPQVYFALLLAAERMAPGSPFRPYLDLLPHPAVDDLAVIAAHKAMLDPPQLLEWDAHQHEFTAIARLLHQEWTFRLGQAHPQASVAVCVPPVQVVYWAIRTTLSRHFQLPRGGVTPTDAGSKLDLYTFDSVKAATASTSALAKLWHTVRGTVRPLSPQERQYDQYELEPMLVPLIDFVGHIVPANVSLGVATRPDVGPCIELTAVDTIREGEEIGAPYNSGHSIAFTLYRFGFLPV